MDVGRLQKAGNRFLCHVTEKAKREPRKRQKTPDAPQNVTKNSLDIWGKMLYNIVVKMRSVRAPRVRDPMTEQNRRMNMKKRLTCLFLCLVMLLSVFLASCAEETDEEVQDAIEEMAAKNTVSLTMWVVSEEKVDPAVAAEVTRAINSLTEAKIGRAHV